MADELTLQERFPFLNTALGLENCIDDEDFYMEILHTFVEDNCIVLLNEFFIRKDWKAYKVKVHALKSSCLHIGAEDLSAKAKALEYAARDQDEAFIELHHYKLLWEYEALLKKINSVFIDHVDYAGVDAVGRFQILVIDDSEMNLDIAEHILAAERYSVMKCQNPIEALEKMKTTVPDLVLLDIHMQEMTGYEVMNAMHSDKRLANVPIVIMTGDDDVKTEVQVLKAGAQDYLRKPISREVMMARINRIIEHNHLSNFFQTEVQRKTEDAENRRLEAEKLTDEIIDALVKTIDAKDKFTTGHSFRVTKYSLMLADKMGYNDREKRLLRYAALLHDIGKIGIPDEILNKTGRLTDEEFAIIKQHPVIGSNILKLITTLPEVAIGARSHHERYDGSGYPDGLAGTEIKEIARIIGVADAYDAMTSARSYRSGMDQQKVRSEIEKGLGSQFDPIIGSSMLELIDADEEFTMRDNSVHDEQ